ncbi:MAG: 1-deoxy-D-xylulose-5-phosphate reductoisomerase [Dehalococcoidia bacterium]|nr:1-deoxy-D-xylulose-5-phosphate reductoisomerase [Dehalococcoidia bacterium]
MDDVKSLRLAVFGSTGSIGRQTLDIVRAFPDRIRIVALAAGSNLNLLSEQINEFFPKFVYHHGDRARLPHGNWEFRNMDEIAAHCDVDTVLAASSGASGLMPLLSAVHAGKTVALANKEALVSAGEIIMNMAARHDASIRPVDSEHSAIWQCLTGETSTPARIIITASGGPFRSYSRREMAEVTAEAALRHPSWKMGKKVTIDSATLMNKGLEVIEAHHLFGIPLEKIDVMVHPQSIVHSLVEFSDGAVKAQLGAPDMRLPIQYAMSHPERWSNDELPKLDFAAIKKLDFEPPDYDRFPCLKLAIEAGKQGGTCPAVLCAADEVAVNLFLEGQIKFTDIAALVDDVLGQHSSTSNPDIEDILQADKWAREAVKDTLKRGTLHCC